MYNSLVYHMVATVCVRVSCDLGQKVTRTCRGRSWRKHAYLCKNTCFDQNTCQAQHLVQPIGQLKQVTRHVKTTFGGTTHNMLLHHVPNTRTQEGI